MDVPAEASHPATRARLVPRTPLAVWLVGIAAALLHIAPYWHAELQTPTGWTFVYNITRSPDLMQYRVWARQSQRSGPIVPNTFTTEPNRPYLPVVFYYLIGKVAAGTGLSPEVVYAYAGSFLAVALTVFLFWTVRLFLTSGASGSSAASSSHAVWWVFLAILLGGG